ncbi:angiotensinogen [Denticeps clupeoides]|uniref:angiotensinogen n=1 Tax=Denticeps clupeoides TaxID=299321 RepID=UPI0010A40601|nr:angiotensinogen-like [Denticeps clupeoides]
MCRVFLKMRELSLVLLLSSWFAISRANRVYVHPFNLFAAENVSCEAIQSTESQKLEVVTPVGIRESTEPDTRDIIVSEGLVNSTEHTQVLAVLQNSLGLHMYRFLTLKQKDTNTLFSPINIFGTLTTLYLGTSKKTAVQYQRLLGLNKDTEREDCVYLIDGHKVLRTLWEINSITLDGPGPQDELRTLVWSFISQNIDISKNFVRGTQEFSDAVYVRAVDFSKPKDAEAQVNSFIQETSDGSNKEIFKSLNSSTDFLFASSVHFKGNWRTAFQPDESYLQQFWLDENATVSVPMMTHTGEYKYLNDKAMRCTVVKLDLSKHFYMLLVLPDKGSSLHKVESQLLNSVISNWYQNLHERVLELSLPKFSLTAVNDLKAVLSDMRVENILLGADAKFQRLTSKENITVDKVFNKVVFEMSEEGSQAPNKTQDGRIPLKVTMNRPFFFAIIERNTNAILMLGKITNPTIGFILEQ